MCCLPSALPPGGVFILCLCFFILGGFLSFVFWVFFSLGFNFFVLILCICFYSFIFYSFLFIYCFL